MAARAGSERRCFVPRWLIPPLWLLAALGCGWIVLTTPVVADLTLFVPQCRSGRGIVAGAVAQRSDHPANSVGSGRRCRNRPRAAGPSRQLAERLRSTALLARVANGADALPEAELQALFAHQLPARFERRPGALYSGWPARRFAATLGRVAVAAGRISETLAGRRPDRRIVDSAAVVAGSNREPATRGVSGSRRMATAPCCWSKRGLPATTSPPSAKR